MLNLGKSNSIIRQTPTLSNIYDDSTFPLLIPGREYYFNQIDSTNMDDNNRYNLKFESTTRGNIYRYQVKQVNNEYYLAELDFARNPVGGSYN